MPNATFAEGPDRGPVTFTITLSPEARELLTDLSRESGDSDEMVFRKALALLKVSSDARKEGKHVGFATDAGALETEIKF